MSTVFLTADWRWLAMLNYRVSSELLEPLVPRGTELDRWNGDLYVSVVGFLFRDTRVLGVPVPWHRTFEEVNLRFYVRRREGNELRRGVVFVREIVPRTAIATVARIVYNEPYVALPMRHEWRDRPGNREPGLVSYGWRSGGAWCHVEVDAVGSSRELDTGSHEEFITEHYWGYTRQRDGGTIEYQVEHPRWRVWNAGAASVGGDLTTLYGRELARVVRGTPASAFLADGSAVVVRAPRRITAPAIRGAPPASRPTRPAP